MSDKPEKPWTDMAECAVLEAAGWPHSLIKATVDPFDYMAALRDGTIIYFEHAVPSDNRVWVNLTIKQMFRVRGPLFGASNAYVEHHPDTGVYDRGVDVRVSDIVWCCDAPYGS